jgi:hypothetical protein
VSPTAFQALDKAIEAGGSNLGSKTLAGSGKAASEILNELCASGFLSKAGGKTAKYSVTPEGRAVWEKEAPPERLRQQQERDREQQKKSLVELISLVQQKQGKTFSKTETTRFSASLRQDACDRKLVELGAKANSYRLMPAGEELLQSDQPLDRQLQRLRQLQQQTVAQWRAAQQRLHQALESMGSPVSQSVQAAADELTGRANQVFQQFDHALVELGAFPVLLTAARQLRQEAEMACQEAVQRLESEKNRLAELEARLNQSAEQQREQLAEFERRLRERLDDLAARLAAGGKSDSEPTKQPDGSVVPSDDAVWEATWRAGESLRQATLRIGGIIKIPELTDGVRKVFPDLGVAAFHDLLQRWQQEDRLTLQLCNDPRLEPRAAEGIPSSRGLLFYVQIR